MKEYFLDLVKEKGGFRCEHAHFDKAFLIEKDLLNDAEIPMTKKWSYYRQLKENYTEEDLYNRMKKCVDLLYKQGVKEATTFVDVDTIVNLKCVDIALKLKENISHYFKLKIAIQPLEGLRSPALKQIYYEAAKKVDTLGALPSRDPDPKKHLEYIFALMKEFNKTLDVHTDQKACITEIESSKLADLVIANNLHGQVRAIHCISLARQSPGFKDMVCKKLKEADITVVVCPSAAISMKQNSHISSYTSNSIAPIKELQDNNVKLDFGVDNIADFFMPLVDGDLWFESRLLMEATRIYDLDYMSDLVTGKLA